MLYLSKFMLLFNLCMHAKSLQSGLTLCDLMDCSLPDSSVHGILKARILELVPCPPQGIFPTQGSNPPLLHLLHWRWVFFFYHYCQLGSPSFNTSAPNKFFSGWFFNIILMMMTISKYDIGNIFFPVVFVPKHRWENVPWGKPSLTVFTKRE